jgi:hypothetical protein
MRGVSSGDLKKEDQDEDGEASDLLRMLIKKLHATTSDSVDTVHLDMDLTRSEMDWLCAWGAENEDLEQDIPPEDSDPLEDGHDREADIWFDDVP